MKILIFTLTLFLSFYTFAEVNVKKLYNQKWITFESEHFRIITNAKEAKAVDMLQDLEDFNYFITQILGFEQNKLDSKLEIISAKNKSTFKAMGLPDHIAGVFIGDSNIVLANSNRFRKSGGKGNFGRQTILHELVHHLIKQSSQKYATPVWFREGIAEYFGSYNRKKGQIILGDMSAISGRFGWILIPNGSRYGGIDSESLFKTKREELIFGEKATKDDDAFVFKFYARALAVVHYMNADPERRKKMYTYLYAVHKGFTEKESFERIFKMTFSEFDDAVADYINSRFIYARVFDVKPGAVELPKIKAEAVKTTHCEAITEVLNGINQLSPRLLGEEGKAQLNKDYKTLLPTLLTPDDGCPDKA